MNLISKVIRKFCFWVCLVKVKFSSKDMLTNFDEKWFEDKRVAIVGGADSVLKEKLGEYIDGFDVVVRINKGVEIIATQSEYVGKKTDVLFHCFYENDSHLGGSPITPELWKENNVKNLLFALNYKHNYYTITNFLTFIKNTKKEYKFSQLPEDQYFKNLEVVQPSGPTTGFIAINTVFNCKPKELYITGITFFKTPYSSEYRNMTDELLKKTLDVNKDHAVEVEYLYVKNLYLKYPEIIKPDDTLKQIFKNN